MTELKGTGDGIGLLQPLNNGFKIKTGQFAIATPLENGAGHRQLQGAFTSRSMLGVSTSHTERTRSYKLISAGTARATEAPICRKISRFAARHNPAPTTGRTNRLSH